jgi:hypothetical protein
MSSIEVDRHGASPGTRSIVARGLTAAQCRAYAIADNLDGFESLERRIAAA